MTTQTNVKLLQDQDYRFAIHFGDQMPVVYGDEPAPLGGGTGPTPAQLLVAAVANCLSDSLLFALRKFKHNAEPIRAEASATIDRNDQGRFRVQQIHVHIHLGVPSHQIEHIDRVLEQFEAFCTVTQSVKQAIEIQVAVSDSEGNLLKGA